ncbi:hypothetical protein [Streptomyces sp. NPDC020965]|uniref:hypothetical protein n=1 Tax=Streptomyces sp. NPDC020965 TaxID=3365105 RepID=UPI003797FD62
MTSILTRGGVAVAIAGLAMLAPAVAHADTGTGASTVAPANTGAGAKESVSFTGWSYEQSSGKAKREAENMARRHALISGFLNEQCVLLYAYSRQSGPGWWDGNAAIRCTR